MNIKYFIQARASQVAGYIGRDNLVEMGVEAIDRDLAEIGHDIEMSSFYKYAVMRTLTHTYEIDVPKIVKKVLA